MIKQIKTYAGYDKNLSERLQSSSGGLFGLFANYIASKNGIIYGVAMTEDCYDAYFKRIDNGDIVSLKGSKYFQAKIGDIFKYVKKDLIERKKVLFSGTGCQINGLKGFLQKEYNNLVTIDVICHGVPSSKLWRKYVYYQEEKNGKLFNVNFRCKDDSWKNFGLKENKKYISKDNDIFMRMFLRDYCLRPSCYICNAKFNKNSDITIGDFWGVENIAPEMDDGKGTSVIIIRTKKGQDLFDNIKQNIKWKEAVYDEVVKYNPAEYKSSIKPLLRNTFYEDLDLMSFDEMKKKYSSDSFFSFLKKILKKIKRIIKRTLRKC